ncbi:MAG: tetratricopeptide repeat protein [Acidobacteriaceae bacterium]|nr:tetratricopeptide repeat protein [Acidobacteriaceae bacterium]
MKFRFRLVAIVICAFAGTSGVMRAQASSTDDFDVLASRASAALRSDPGQAVPLYRQALALKPDWAEGWFDLGGGLYQIDQFSEAEQAFRKAAALAPGNGAVWGFLGLCESRLGKYREALTDIHKGEVAGLPDNLPFVSAVHNEAALIYLRSHDYSGSIEELRVLAKAGDNSSPTVRALGVTALGMPYMPNELPGNKLPLVDLAGRAALAFYAGNGDEGAPLFKQLIAQYPNEPGVHYFVGISLLERDPNASLAEFRKELAISPSHVQARQQIAMIEIKTGDAASAAVITREALQLQPLNALSHAILGRAYEHMGRHEDATSEFETAVKLAPDNPELHFSLGQNYRRVGRIVDADKQIAEFKRLKSIQDSRGVSAQDGPGENR